MPITHYNNNNNNNNKHNSKTVRSNSLAEKKWWQKLAFARKSKFTSTSQRLVTTAVQDWITLSPNDPPLPFLLSATSPSSCNNIAVSTLTNPCSVVQSSIKFSEADRFTSELAPIFKECQSNALCSFPSSTSFSAAAAVTGGRDLYTIEETSEISTLSNSSHINTSSSIKEDSISRNIASSSLMSINQTHCNNISCHNNSNDNMSLDGYETAPSSWSISPPTSPIKFKPIPNIRIIDVKEDSVATNDNDDDTNILSISNATNQLPPSSASEPKMILVEDDDENDSMAFTPIFEWPTKFIKSPEPHFDPSLVGNEDECRLHFCKLVAQAYQQYRQGYHGFPKDVHVRFDEKGNIQGITIISQKGTRDDYLEFGGSPQYIAPELSISPAFNYEQSSIWALGISLYRMLVGKYPFYSTSGRDLPDRELFRKMFTSDFVLSKALSSDVRDLIQRMLSPENARASFDLVMFHPWIQPYVCWSDSVVKDHQKQAETVKAAAALLTTTSAAPSQAASKSKSKKHRKRIKKAVRIIRKVIRIIFRGPYPPPASYLDLVDPNYKKKSQ